MVEMEAGRYATQASLAARFQISFSKKIHALCCNTTQPPIDDVAKNITALLVCFEVASPTDVKNIILCELDPLPTSVLQQHINALCPDSGRIHK